jgi:hypothetical protein
MRWAESLREAATDFRREAVGTADLRRKEEFRKLADDLDTLAELRERQATSLLADRAKDS